MSNIDYFTSRKTVRKYSDKKIPRQDIVDLLEAASHAPTTGNMQLYSVVIADSDDAKAQLAPAHFNQPSVMSASAVLTFCADFNRFVKWCEQSNAKHGFDNFQAWIWAVEDTMIFAQQFVTLAEMNGFGTCYLGTTTYNAPEIAKILSLPDMTVPVTTVTVGWPAESPKQSERLPIDAIVHFEKYNDYTPAQIDQIHAEKEALLNNQRFVSENMKQNLAQVFTDIRYPKKDNEYFSKVYKNFVIQKGFNI